MVAIGVTEPEDSEGVTELDDNEGVTEPEGAAVAIEETEGVLSRENNLLSLLSVIVKIIENKCIYMYVCKKKRESR